VAKEDMGKVIGKQGRIAQAIRTILSAASAKVHKRTGLNLPQFNGHFKKYTEKWYTMQKKGVSDERKAAEIQPRV
jgi:predicted RNA-binding protein Jag